MWKFFVAVAAIWLALLPPFFTDGACTAELEAASAAVDANADSWTSAQLAAAYWQKQAVPVSVISVERCQKVKPRFLSACGDGPLVVASIPVSNRICRIYRDDEISVRLQFDELERLRRITTEMSPYKSLPIPFTTITLHWAR